MLSESFIRKSIWTSVPINLIGAISFAMPSSFLGHLAGLPAAPAIYRAMMGFMIILFGGAYAWIASQPAINRPMLTLGALGKLGVFSITAMLFTNSAVPAQTVMVISVDLALATLWLYWLWNSRTPDTPVSLRQS